MSTRISKNVIQKTKGDCISIYIVFLFVLGIPFSSIAQVGKNPFSLRYNTEQNGGITFVSNSVFTIDNINALNEIPPLGYANNNEHVCRFVDVDTLANTFNSSSADLNLPDCSTVTFAGLYWGGSLTASNSKFKDRSRVKLKIPGSSFYLDLVADQAWNGQYFKDITNILTQSSGFNGTFTVANIVLDNNLKNIYGGWTIVIVYKNNLMPLKNITVFDGMVTCLTDPKIDFSISGISTPPVGPVDLDFGFVAYDGDRGGFGDYMAINGKRVYDATHNNNNTFNSSISLNGSIVKTRAPAYDNTMGYDAGIIHIENSDFSYVKNSSTDALISLKTEGDVYTVGVLTAAIDIYRPNLQLNVRYKEVENPDKLLRVGEKAVIEYNLKNIGNDLGRNTVFKDTVPDILSYEESSLEIQIDNGAWIKLTDDAGDDNGSFNNDKRIISCNIGEVYPGSVVKLRYKAKLVDDRDKVRCANGVVPKVGWLTYSGNITSNWGRQISSEKAGLTDDCSIGGILTIPVEIPPVLNDIDLNIYCSGTPVSDLNLPKGYALYKADDVTFQHPLDKLGEPGVYKAYRKLSTGCEYSFNVIARADSVTIYSQPDNIEATVGSGVAFSVGVKGENVSFQWQVNKGTGTWEDISGATERSLTIPKVTEEMDGYNYRLRVTTPCKDYLLSVKVVLSVKRQPVSKPSEEPEPQPEVKDQNVGALFVPNAFMPASNTQELRSFVVKGHGLAKWQMTIFNKWDQVIWKTDVIGADGSPAESWDGKMFGADAPQGAYMWAIEAVFEDGKEWEGMSVRDAKPRKSGVVYLLR